MSAIFAFGGNVMGGNFAEAPDWGVFGSGALRKVWYVTRTACLTRILTRTAQAVSERARQSTSQRRRRRASRALVKVEDVVGGAGRHRSAFARSERAEPHRSCTSEPAGGPVTDQRLAGLTASRTRPPVRRGGPGARSHRRGSRGACPEPLARCRGVRGGRAPSMHIQHRGGSDR